MKIGIDIDGVLTNLSTFQAKEGKKFFNDELHFFNDCAYDFKDMFNCTKEEKAAFWKKIIYIIILKQIVTNMQAR